MINLFKSCIVFLFKLYAKRRYQAFREDLKHPKVTQLRVRHELEKKYLKSARYNYTQIPFGELKIHSYNDLLEVGAIEDVCSDKILFFEETSGSSGIKKKIPYTKALLKSFSDMFILWAYDIVANQSFKSYKFYFSISPQFSASGSGLEDDSDYLGPILSKVLSPFVVVLKGASRLYDSDEFLMKLGLRLVSQRDLEIISIWSPTFLLSLIHFIHEHEEEFKTHLKIGSYKGLNFKSCELEGLSPRSLFPSLRFISSWGSASAALKFNQLKELFPEVMLQKKGLLATEAPMTIPLLGHAGGAPLINEIFFEFITEKEEIKYLWELELGEVYELIISQKGGLYRYPMKDLVEVVGILDKTPLLDFKGRSSQTSDMVGEKLHESEAFASLVANSYALIASEMDLCYYVLADDSFKDSDLELIENKLRENPHYLNSRKLKQLNDLRVLNHPDPRRILRMYHQEILGINSGDVKDASLIYREGDELIKRLR